MLNQMKTNLRKLQKRTVGKRRLLVLLLMIAASSTEQYTTPNQYRVVTTHPSIDRNQLTLENVYYWIKKYNIKEPDIVLCQCVLETGYLKHVYNKNNIFNFKYSKRYSVGIGRNKSNHAEYSHWVDCVEEYYHWQNRRTIKKGENYYQFLVRYKYAEDPNYVKKLQMIRKKLYKDGYILD